MNNAKRSGQHTTLFTRSDYTHVGVIELSKLNSRPGVCIKNKSDNGSGLVVVPLCVFTYWLHPEGDCVSWSSNKTDMKVSKRVVKHLSLNGGSCHRGIIPHHHPQIHPPHSPYADPFYNFFAHIDILQLCRNRTLLYHPRFNPTVNSSFPTYVCGVEFWRLQCIIIVFPYELILLYYMYIHIFVCTVFLNFCIINILSSIAVWRLLQQAYTCFA